eukprot:CAMPEP_0194489032 /NCGR_PEP_ID=MMETSP0253-20130528/8733_1 /TAXON_ID=2966 /ORGANISM="Noctiluca scintillans" /LENGTH=84 /DNA_ID=CAMNT_0039329459 /DNA_START=725 /DNA_END=980 /DNA_ORIENTATION=-
MAAAAWRPFGVEAPTGDSSAALATEDDVKKSCLDVGVRPCGIEHLPWGKNCVFCGGSEGMVFTLTACPCVGVVGIFPADKLEGM